MTVLVGPSDAGKSSCLRALRWVATNLPKGTKMTRWGSNKVTATLKFDGRKARRRRGTGINAYNLDGVGMPSAGNGTPGPVADAINLGDVNFQGQHDAAYWFLLSPAEVSRRLNSIINLSVMDRAMNVANARVRDTEKEIKLVRGRIKTHKQRRAELAWAVALGERLTEAERIQAESEGMARRSHRIAQAVRSCNQAKDAALRAESRLNAALRKRAACREAVDLANRRLRLGVLADEARLLLRTAARPPRAPALRTAYRKYKKLADRRSRLGSLVMQLQTSRFNCDLARSGAEAAHKILEGVKTCPLCRQPLGNR